MNDVLKAYLLPLLVTFAVVSPAFAQEAPADSTEIQRIQALSRTDRPAAAARAQRYLASLEGGPDSVELAEALLWVVKTRAFAEGNASRSETEPLARRAIEMYERLPEPDGRNHGDAYRELGVARYIQGDYETAERHYLRCLALLRESLGPEAVPVGQILYNLSSAAKAQGDFERSAEYNREAHDVYVAALGEGHPQIAYTLNQRANLFSDQGRLEESLELYRRALAIVEEAIGTDHPFYAGVSGNIGGVLRELGRYDEALRMAERAVELKETRFGPDHEELLDALDDLAHIHLDRAELTRSRETYERSLRIARAHYPDDHFEVAVVLNNLAIVEDRSGNVDEALRLYEQALRIKEGYAEERTWDLALALGNLGGVLIEAGQVERGVPLVERALALREEVYGPDHPLVASNLATLFEAALLRKEYARARVLANRMLEIRQAIYEPSHPRIAVTHFSLGVLALHEGNAGEALEYAQLAVAATRDVFGESHPDLARDLGLRAVAHHHAGDRGAAMADALRVEEIGADHLRLTIASSAERHALGYAAVRPQGIGLALSWVDPATPPSTLVDIWDALIRNRSMVLEEMMLRRAQSRDLGDPNSPEAEALVRASTRLANLVIRGPGDDPVQAYGARLVRARREKEEAERAMAARSERFRSLATAARVGYPQVAGRLDDGDLLVAFVRAAPPDFDGRSPGEAYYAFVLRGGGEPELHRLGSARRIDAQIMSWRSEIERGPFVPDRTPEEAERRALRAGAALTRQLVEPWLDRLAGVSRLVVVPAGAIHQVNLAALPVDGRYLLEHDVLIQTLQAERDLAAPPAPAGGDGVLVLGGAEYDAQLAGTPTFSEPGADETTLLRGSMSSCSEFQTLRFEPLPATAGEIQDVAGLFPPTRPTQILSGAAATEAEFKRQAGGQAVLHLATHAFFLGDACAGARDEGGVRAALGEGAASLATETPLLLSGLAFAGANRRHEASGGEDGILTAEEVAALDLNGVQWAVLSACETGGGVLRSSEGVLGLPRAFRTAGVRTVVLSLWRVEDTTTRDWMRAMYRGHLERGLDAPRAVRYAAREVLQRRRDAMGTAHPFYWAPFLALGN